MMKVSRGSKGFTLIELLIVIAIIGILAAIAIPAYNGYTTKARISGVTNAMGAIKNAINAYYTDNLGYPPALASATAIGQTLGVTPPVQYCAEGSWSVSSANPGEIIATVQNVGSGQDTKTIVLSPTITANNTIQWAWSGTVDSTYRPR
jgi:type IV pilus assembly protein PilA